MTNQEKYMGKLEGKIALITGGNGGIGLETAKQFVNQGACVFITGGRDPELVAAVKEIGKNVIGVQGKVSNLGDLDRLFAQIKRQKRRLDIVFLNAGVEKRSPFNGLEGAPHSRERREPRPSRHAQAEGLTTFQRSGRASFGVDFEPCFSPEVRYARGNR
jgi:NAD(P)-dependent dehydrogenase (short-subunit alcohol dehydrogenase family)